MTTYILVAWIDGTTGRWVFVTVGIVLIAAANIPWRRCCSRLYKMKAAPIDVNVPMPPANEPASVNGKSFVEERIELMSVQFGVLDLRPGDIVVLLADKRLSLESEARIQGYVRPFIPLAHEIIILDNGLQIGVIRPGGAGDG